MNWLVSRSFGLGQARSVAAERAIKAAQAWRRGERAQLPKGLDSQAAIHQQLLKTLPGGDHFWPDWIVASQAGEA